jgi:hypothetical protein
MPKDAPLNPREIRELVKEESFDRSALLAALIRCWGGVGNLASDIYEDYRDSAKGTMARQRFLDLVARLISAETASMGPQRSVEDMGDEEIADGIRGLMERANDLRVGVQDAGHSTAGQRPAEEAEADDVPGPVS